MIFYSDFDGTLTKEGRELTREFFEILELVDRQNHELVIVSGRSLSWGHFFLTHFPLKACIMEGGGVILSVNDKREIVQEPLVSQTELEKLSLFTDKLKTQFPNLPISADSFGRLTDRAIEFQSTDEHLLNDVMAFMREENINYSKSNVHINFWAGEISKYKGVQYFSKNYRRDIPLSRCWFFGDAPNDQSMFESFENSVGVSNISHSLHKLDHKPRIILEGEDNAGPKGVLSFIKNIYQNQK